MSIVGVLRSRAAFVVLAAIALVALGVSSARKLPSSIYPDVDFPRVVVVVHAGDVPADLMQATVTRILEEAVATTPNLQRLRSRTIRGACELSLQFRAGTDMWRSLQLVQSEVATARGALPAEAEIEVERVTPTALPIITFNVHGEGVDPRVLRDAAERTLRPILARVEGIGMIEVAGGEVREVEVLVRPAALAALHLPPSELATSVGESLRVVGIGRSLADHQQWPVLASAAPTSAAELAALPVAMGSAGPLTLASVADVVDGSSDPSVRVTGKPGDVVVVAVSRAAGASTPAVAQQARDAVAQAVTAHALPTGVGVDVIYDQSELIDDSIAGVRDAILLGIALSLVVLGLALKNLRAGAVAALAVPITLVGTFALIKFAGQTLNLMSLGGLAIAIGLVIDDAIVVVEAIVLQLEEGADVPTAVETGTRSLAAAVIGTTATTVLVFAPLALLSGVVGSFFGALAVTLCASVLLSLVIALTVVPLAALGILKPMRKRAHTAGRIDRMVAWLTRGTMKRPILGILAILLALAAGMIAGQRVRAGFLPAMDEGALVVDFFAPAGTSLDETDRMARAIDHILSTTPGIVDFTRRTGAEMGPAAATQQNRGDTLVRLAPRKQRRSVYAIMEEIRTRAAADVPELEVELIQVLQDVLDDLSGNPRPIEVKVFGPDRKVLEALATEIGAKLEPAPDLEDVYDGVEGAVPVVRVDVQTAAATRLGITAARVIADLGVLLDGLVVGQIYVGDRAIDVRVRGSDSLRFVPEGIGHLPLAAGDASIAADSVARITWPASPSVLERENLTQVVMVTASVKHGGDLAAATADVATRIRGVKIPEGYRVTLDGQLANAKQTRNELAGVFAAGVFLVLGVLVLQLRSLRLALVVLLGIPLALAGAALALWITDTALDASSLMGCVLLAGLVVKNGILLLEHARSHADAEHGLREALLAAAARRMRPILSTSVATIAGLLPLALGIGAGSELQRPLAIATIGGLVLATLVTLVVMPAIAALVMPTRRIAPPQSS